MQLLNAGKVFDFLFAVFPGVDWDSHYYDNQDQRTLDSYKIADDSLGKVRAHPEKKVRTADLFDTILKMERP